MGLVVWQRRSGAQIWNVWLSRIGAATRRVGEMSIERVGLLGKWGWSGRGG